MKKIQYTLGILLIAVLVGCNLPQGQATQSPDIAYTAAALTVEAALTHVAETLAPTQTLSPSATPLIQNTPIPTNTFVPMITNTPQPCNVAKFIGDVTYPDTGPGTGQNVDPGTHFTKTWRFQNVGTCTWNSAYQLVFISGNAMSGPASQTLTPGTVSPLQTLDVSVDLVAPAAPGASTGYWKLRDQNGVLFGLTDGKPFYVTINVNSTLFAVTSVSLGVSGSCGAFHITAAITTNGAGTVTYHWVRSDGAIDAAVYPPLVFASAGTQSVSTDWAVSAVGAKWMDLYNDAPNHQQFGRANFSCP